MARLEESVLGAGFVAMTENELYAVNGGKGRGGKLLAQNRIFPKSR